MFVLHGEAKFSSLEPKAVSDFMSVTNTLDSFDSDNQGFHVDCKMDKSRFNLNVSHVGICKIIEKSRRWSKDCLDEENNSGGCPMLWMQTV
jgi:hypothetical protein